MPCDLVKYKAGATMWWNFTTTKYTPNTMIFKVTKIGKLWWLQPFFNCLEYQPFHKTLDAAIVHYWIAYTHITDLPKHY